ncbi:MAG: 1,4-dihydroxy-6-naphthoate synthase [Proteobacteria bacterium]|nr:1,4-dihydroxy-6-naphthoate synthase [Pseudomonadota bacterium]MBU1686578.1 1,4-dihydroxy-6-naphthoate synthase [Pseudomonadota bacterium]
MPGKEKTGLTLGFSPCPNDTFIFHDFIHGLAGRMGLDFSEPVLADVETLNDWAIEGRLDVTKLSFHALGHVLDRYVLLQSGSALGRGCGPLLISKGTLDRCDLASWRIAIPGKLTTAAMLLRLYEPACLNTVVMRFDRIIPALLNGEVEAGLIIHESRFTYHTYDLKLMVDLGAWWEETYGLPIPLGGIAAKRSLGQPVLRAIEKGIRQSVVNGFQDPLKSASYIRSHAQEMDEKVIAAHIDLYVNRFSESLGEEGNAAVKIFMQKGVEAGIFSSQGEKIME